VRELLLPHYALSTSAPDSSSRTSRASETRQSLAHARGGAARHKHAKRGDAMDVRVNDVRASSAVYEYVLDLAEALKDGAYVSLVRVWR
jgi:hypothetical protein